MLIGNAIVGQSGGPTAAINATLAGVIKGAFESEAINTVYGALNGVEGILKGTICNLSEIIKGEEDLELLAHTPAAALGSCRLKLPKMDESPRFTSRLSTSLRSTISVTSSISAVTILWIQLLSCQLTAHSTIMK